MTSLYAGTGRSDITPPVGIAHGCWGAQTHQRAERVDMPLTCTALVIADGENEIAIIDIDLVWLTPAQDRLFKAELTASTGIPAGNIRISYSHTHSGSTPEFTWMSEGDELIEPYEASLPAMITGAVAQARGRMRPVRVGSGRGSCAMNVNRRTPTPDGSIIVGHNWDGFVDRDVLVLAIDDLAGEPVATIVNYACHGTTMGPGNRALTPDFAGPTRETVERNVGGTCLFLQGATGNLHPIVAYSDDPRDYRRNGLMLGLEAAKVRLDINSRSRNETLLRIVPSGADYAVYEESATAEPDSTLKVVNRILELPLKDYPPVDEAQAEFDRRKAELVRVRAGGGDEKQIAEAAWPARRAELALHHARIFGGGKAELQIQAFRLGDAALICVPLEVFAESGAAVKQRSPAPFTLFSGYSNGYYGYIPIRSAFPEGGYEVRTSPYQPDAAEKLEAACLEVLEELWS